MLLRGAMKHNLDPKALPGGLGGECSPEKCRAPDPRAKTHLRSPFARQTSWGGALADSRDDSLRVGRSLPENEDGSEGKGESRLKVR